MSSEPQQARPSAGPRPAPSTREHLAGQVRGHQRAVFAYLESLGCPPELVEDLAQETFVTTLRAGFADRDERSTRAWLRTVAHSRYVDHLRREGHVASVDLDEASAAWRRFEGEDGGDTYREALRACLAALDERARRVLQLFYGAGRDRTSVATEVGLTLGGVKAVLSRSRARLRSCIERRLA